MYTALSIILLVLEAALIGFFIYKVIKSKKPFTKKTLWYALPVFAILYCIFVMGYVYSGKQLTILNALKLIQVCLDVYIFKVELSIIALLVESNIWFHACAIVATILAGATLIASAIGLWGAKFKNMIEVNSAIRQNKDFVLGCSENALNYAKDNNAIVVNFSGEEKQKSLVLDGYDVLFADMNKQNNKLKRKFKKNITYKFIAFADNKFQYSKLISWFNNQFGEIEDCYFTLHIEASITEMDIINRKFIDNNKRDNICVKSFNKYELIARKFTMENPMSTYLPEDFYCEHRTIKTNKKINVVCLGFGKVNYELVNLLIMQNQFVSLNKAKDKFVNHPVNYYIFDNSEDKIYSNLFFRINGNLGKQKTTDLPMPEKICNIVKAEKENIYSTQFANQLNKIVNDEDVYSPEFSQTLSEIVDDKNAFTYIIVSIGTDYENMAYAEQLQYAYDSSKFKIFARIKENSTLKENNDNITCFGFEKDIYCHDVIVNETLDALAKSINSKYNNDVKSTIIDYNSRPTIERYSNIYHAISIFFKMGLLNFKFVKKEEVSKNQTILNKQDLFSAYENYNSEANYDKYFNLNVWTMLGFSEHSRWVAQYLLKGFHQMPYSKIKVENKGGKVKVIGKDVEKREHCCITDYYSLDSYHKHILDIYNQNGSTKTINDVETYKYDYMFVNESYDDMISNGYVLVKNK